MFEQQYREKVKKLATIAQPDASMFNGKVVPGNYQGFFAVEMRNITFAGEREAALRMIQGFAAYDKIDGKIRAAEQAGRHADAVELCIGSGKDQSNAAFERFDGALREVIAINHKEFDRVRRRRHEGPGARGRPAPARRAPGLGPRAGRPPPSPPGVRRVSQAGGQPGPLEQIDLLLAAWDERLRRMDENLVALESEAIYQILAGKAGKRPALEGITRERVSPALDAVSELFENRERLSGVVARAREVRASISALTFWEKDDKLAEIHRLLRGTSIELGQKVVALSERNLLDQGYHDVLIEPERLLAEMADRFQQARTVLLAVSHAWEALDPEMTQIETRMSALRALAADIQGAKELTELTDAEAELAALRARVAKDPLGAANGIEQIRPRLVALRARLDHLVGIRDRVTATLDAARDRSRRLAEGHERARRLADQVGREIEGEAVQRAAQPLDEGQLSGLAEWLHKLEGTVAARRWAPAEIGLTRWHETAASYQAVDDAATSGAEALLGRRAELGGRLSARRAQAAALAARGLRIDPAFEARARDAEALLRRRPLPVDAAARAVEEYEAAVVALAARRT